MRRLNLLHATGNAERFERGIASRLSALIDLPDVTITAIRIFKRICAMANRRDGTCYPAVATLASVAGVSVQAAREACRLLERKGFIHTVLHAGPGGTNVYYLDFRALGPKWSEGETAVSDSLNKGIFGETGLSAPDVDGKNLIELSRKLRWDDV